MAPDFEKKREPRRATAPGTRHHIVAPPGRGVEGMLLMRCPGNPVGTDRYYHHGKSAS